MAASVKPGHASHEKQTVRLIACCTIFSINIRVYCSGIYFVYNIARNQGLSTLEWITVVIKH